MCNLTPDQLTLLKWMRTGRTFQICSEYCPNYGDVQPKTRLPIRVFKKTIEKLFQEGLITYKSTLIFGIRWDVFSLTEKGRAAT